MRILARITPTGRAIVFLPDTKAPDGFVYTHPDGLLPAESFAATTRPRTPREVCAAEYAVNAWADEQQPGFWTRLWRLVRG